MMKEVRVWVGLAILAVALSGCEAGTTPEAPPRAQMTDSPSEPSVPNAGRENVTRLPSHVTSAVAAQRGLPASFPADLDRLPEFEASPGAGAWLTYRPRETLGDGSGWSSETIALWNGSWTKLSLGRLGLPEGTWPGSDMLGPGELDDTGTQLAFDASRGVIVVDLTSGRWDSYLEDVGRVGGIRWYPGGNRLVANPWEGPDKVVNVKTGEATDSSAPAFGSGFRGDRDVLIIKRRGDIDRVRDTRGSNVTDLPASPRQSGRHFASWWAGDRVAYSNWETVGGRYALRVADAATGQPVAILTWSRQTGMFVRIHGWWGERRLLLSMDKSLITWTPETGDVVRVAALPRSDLRQEHASVGISFRQPRPAPGA